MSIIKNGRINIWNAVKKQFEVVHPETETARITDFADGIVQKLALTSAMTAVTALQTNSWFGQLLKLVLNASGMKYLISQNGYICFGSLFGGLILQWGTWMESDSAKSMTVKLPISARIYQVFLTDSSLEGNSAYNFTMCWDRDHVGTNVSSFNVKSTDPPSSFSWFFVGRAN